MLGIMDSNKGIDVFCANLVADNGGVLDIVKSQKPETSVDTDF